MAARTPTTTVQHSIGSNRLVIATFSDIDDNDTWESNMPSITAFWTNATDDPTQTNEKIDASVSDATPGKLGIFTFYTGEASRAGMVYVLSKA